MRKLLLPAVASAILVGTAHAELVITEIHYNPNGSESGVHEWIEIYNNSATPLDLSGFHYADIQDWDGTLTSTSISNPFPAGTTLPAFGAAIVVNQPASEIETIWGSGIQVINYVNGSGEGGISLANGASATNETVAILNSALNVVDAVNYENNTNGWPGNTNQATIYLKPDAISQAANDIGSNWAISVAGVDGAYEALALNPGISNATLPDIGSPGVVVVPEPAALSLLALGSIAMIRRRRA
ncbi:MAG TPA: lamin tail domain-containing protein [Tepidisphaeraceae bacterium]|nr:lamin tail domain-containing protein [Tepidisphaeraceae bacterium]